LNDALKEVLICCSEELKSATCELIDAMILAKDVKGLADLAKIIYYMANNKAIQYEMQEEFK
jgi:hypothetical protein